jgi:hypothetical protein
LLARRPAERARRASGAGRRVGIDALGVVLLELDRRDVTNRGVQAVVVEPAEPLDNRQLGLLDRARQVRSAISSVLKESTNDSARALSYASPVEPREPSTSLSSRAWVNSAEVYCPRSE